MVSSYLASACLVLLVCYFLLFLVSFFVSISASLSFSCILFCCCIDLRRIKLNIFYSLSYLLIELYSRIAQTEFQQVRQWGLTYIHTCRPTSTRRAIFHKQRISSVTFTVGIHTLNFTSQWLADSSDFWFLGSKVSQNRRFFAHNDDEPLCKS